MNSLLALVPLSIVVAASLGVLLLEAFLKNDNKNPLAYLSLAFLVAGGIFCIRIWGHDLDYFNGWLFLDKLALLFSLFFFLAVVFVVLMSMKYLSLQDMNRGEYFALLLFALSGMLIMVSSSNLLVIFLGLEVLSVSSYALAGMKTKDEKSIEASLKYFLLGSFASAVLVFGLAFLYGTARSVDIGAVLGLFRSGGASLLTVAGFGMVLAGLAFKIAVVPFHMWTPDVYEGSPTPVTAFFSVGPKAVGLAVLIRLLMPFWGEAPLAGALFWSLWAVAALTMIVGNLTALRQTNVKRILAYSSISHAGYLLVGLLAQDAASLLFYLIVYLFMNIGAFSAVLGLSRKGTEYLELEDYAGIGFKYPWIGATFTVFLLSLAGFPPTGGFLAKFYVFSAAVRQDLVPLVVIGVLTSLVSVFYYLRIVVFMYMRQPGREVQVHTDNPALFLVLFLCLYGVLQLGLNPGNILAVIRQALL